jgi:hypothetical protein
VLRLLIHLIEVLVCRKRETSETRVLYQGIVFLKEALGWGYKEENEGMTYYLHVLLQ